MGLYRRVRMLGGAALLLSAGAAVCRYPEAVATGGSRGLALCGTVLIPSLLPFLVLTGTFVRSSLCGAVGRRLQKPIARLFRLPGECAGVILLAMIGGYPAGATAIAELLERRMITPAEGERLLHFCVNAGPAFAIGAVGAGMLGDARIGWLLLAAEITASLLIGFLEARSVKPSAAHTAAAAPAQPFAVAFCEAVDAAAAALLYMCGFVVLFAVVLALLDAGGISARLPAPFADLLPGLLEVSSGCVAVCGDRRVHPFLLGFLLGFGGISVQCQLRALLHRFPACCRRLTVYRLLHGLLGGSLAALLFRIIPFPAQTLAPGEAALQLFTATPAVSLAMLAMVICVTARPQPAIRIRKPE